MIYGPDIASVEALAQVEVVWQDILQKEEAGYRVGVRFVKISGTDMGKLKKFLNHLDFKMPSDLILPPNLLTRKTQKPKG